MIARIALRSAVFAAVAFFTVLSVDGWAAGGVTPRILTRAVTVAAVGSAVYAAIRALIAWVKT